MGKVFVNVRLPIQVLDAINNIHQVLRERGFKGEFQMPHRSHITVAFYGNFDDEDNAGVLARVQNAVEQVPAFGLSFSRISEFVNDNNRVVWLGVEPERELAEMHDILSFPDINEYRFDEYRPHITLIMNANDASYSGIEIPKITFRVTEVTLSGSSDDIDYKVLGTAKLKTGRLKKNH